MDASIQAKQIVFYVADHGCGIANTEKYIFHWSYKNRKYNYCADSGESRYYIVFLLNDSVFTSTGNERALIQHGNYIEDCLN